MRVLLLGGGGREHALGWKLAQEAEVHAAPGNPGLAEIAECHDDSATDVFAVNELARSLSPDLVVIGPEAPLFAGVGDALRTLGFAVFGPDRAPAEIEGSKAFSKELMARAGVPTARSWTCLHLEDALSRALHLLGSGAVVLKASGPSFARGVVICRTLDEVEDTLRRWFIEGELGDAGKTVVVEEFLEGREFSLFTLAGGGHLRHLPIAQDYKKIFDGDKGPNTGGMGSYSPVPWVTSNLIEEAEQRVAEPILGALTESGLDYRGVLFSGLIATANGLRCLEYNARFGDPETQSLMPRLGSGFLDALMASANGAPIPEVQVLPNAAVTVVLASANYPGPVEKGIPIEIDSAKVGDALLFHSGTALTDGQLVTAGGRVIGVTAVGATVEEARTRAYNAANGVTFEGKQFRSDIGK